MINWLSVLVAGCVFGTLALPPAFAADTRDALQLLDEARTAAENQKYAALKVSDLGKLAVLYYRIDRRANAEQMLEHALAEARREEDFALEAEVAQRRAEIGDATAALVAAGKLLETARNERETEAKIRTMAALAKVYCASGRIAEALSLMSSLSGMLIPASEDAPQLKALKFAAMARLRDAQLYCGQLEEIIQANDPRRRPTLLVDVAAKYADAGTYERAEEVARGIPQPEWKAAALLAIARAKAREDKVEEGEAFAQRAYRIITAELHDNSNPYRQFRLMVNFGRTFGELGLREAALQLLEDASRFAQMVVEKGALRIELRPAVVRAYAGAGELERAIALARMISDNHARADALASVVSIMLGCHNAMCT